MRKGMKILNQINDFIVNKLRINYNNKKFNKY